MAHTGNVSKGSYSAGYMSVTITYFPRTQSRSQSGKKVMAATPSMMVSPPTQFPRICECCQSALVKEQVASIIDHLRQFVDPANTQSQYKMLQYRKTLQAIFHEKELAILFSSLIISNKIAFPQDLEPLPQENRDCQKWVFKLIKVLDSTPRQKIPKLIHSFETLSGIL